MLDWVRKDNSWFSDSNGTVLLEIFRQYSVFSSDENGNYTEEWDGNSQCCKPVKKPGSWKLLLPERKLKQI